MTPRQIFIRHIVGTCPVDRAPILDSGYDDDPEHWEHAVAPLPWEKRTINDRKTMNTIPETQTIQLNADGPLASEMSTHLAMAIRRARKGGTTRLLDGEACVAEIGPPRVELDLSPLYSEGVSERRNDAIDFYHALESLINRFSRENRSNTPDYLLAGFLETCLKAFEGAVNLRDQWYGVHLAPGEAHFVTGHYSEPEEMPHE